MKSVLLAAALGSAILSGCSSKSSDPDPAPVCATPPCVSALAAGSSHTCALVSGGAVKCWGRNTYGALGNGITTSSPVPVNVSNLSGATKIGANGDIGCAIVNNGAVKCWGDNEGGQLGTGSANTALVEPTPVSGLTGVAEIAVGDVHTCAIASGGAVKCWGYNGDGQLGIGSTTSRTAPADVAISAGVMSGGYAHSCAVVSGGAVKCWGRNTDGQLGNPDAPIGAMDSRSTVPVDVPGVANVTAVAAGGQHTCALSSSGAVNCWGWNAFGQLGNNVFGGSVTPVTVDLAGATAIAITVGGVHSCALLSSGAVKCWGDNAYGQLGDGTTTGGYAPVSVASLSGVIAIEAGSYHTCALLGSGPVKCWGWNASGQLGNGTTTDSNIPVAVTF